MRLTLRTLLNWLNNNLSAADAALVAQKVEESELAKALKAQIEGIMAQEHLPAPELLDGTPKGNANAAAEYLDNSMDPKQTPDFEKFCIHSDIMLGEIAGCHEILSQALTQKLELAPELRVKLCDLYKFIDANDESSIPLPQSKSQPIQEEEEIFDEIPENSDTDEPVLEEVIPEKGPSPQPNVWKITAIALIGVDVLYILGRLFGLLP
ncbi:MAG: hypothetical protein IJK97_01065 [Thermoguttaceae bacterium]|nr:hypothetical protein [Thermoguttaceae bacterium]MBR0190856.1 hypothetical protein [Thermoguttaceae bacterium]